MAKDPAFLLYYKDWLGTTRFMKADDKGYFMDLLCIQADIWTIPEEVIEEAVPAENWQRIRKKFTKERHGFYNEMQREKLERRRKYVESRRINGNKGGRPKKHKDNHKDKLVPNLPVNATVNEVVVDNPNRKTDKQWDEDFLKEF